MENHRPEDFKKPFLLRDTYAGEASPHFYWIHKGKVMAGPEHAVAGADPASFVYFLGGFAKDKRHGYCLGRRLKGANATHFRALNNTYCKDDGNVWCIGGRINEADAATFEACDDGIRYIAGLPMPYGYGKDKDCVFYYDFNGKACRVKKADAGTFVSFNDGYFGKDDRTAFFGHASIQKADICSWGPIGGLYSKDGRRAYYANHAVEGADPDTFRFVATPPYQAQTALDANTFYGNGVDIRRNPSMAQMWCHSLAKADPVDLSHDERIRLLAMLAQQGISV